MRGTAMWRMRCESSISAAMRASASMSGVWIQKYRNTRPKPVHISVSRRAFR